MGLNYERKKTLRKDRLNSNGQQFYQNQQDEQSPLNDLGIQEMTKCDVGNTGKIQHTNTTQGLRLWCLTPLYTIFQLYSGGQKTTDMPQVTD